MFKKFNFLIVGLSLSIGVLAAPISPEAALERLKSGGPSRMPGLSSLKLAHVAKSEKGVASAYVFVRDGGVGFTVLSADDRVLPVLGYSNTGKFDRNNIPPAMTWWLGELSSSYVNSSNNCSSENMMPYAPSDMKELTPLLSTTWNQDAPYNLDAPFVGGNQAPTGCVATSVAQVMNYFKWPEKNKGIIKYYDGNTLRTLNLRTRGDFKWDLMLDSYAESYTDEQAEAVAYLMQAAGYAVEMKYGSLMSGTQSYKIANALVSYFGYDQSVRYCEREYYSPTEWTRMVYDNIKEVGPVIYDGQSIDGGHSFVCDGYDGKGYFHFNWGWGGMSDGYYLLDSLNPESQGIGGAEGGFNHSQGAIFGMQKPTGNPAAPDYDKLRIYGTIEGSLLNGYISMRPVNAEYAGWSSGSARKVTCNIGGIFQSADDTGTFVADVQGVMAPVGQTSGFAELTVDAAQYYSGSQYSVVVKIPDGLADGRYKVYCASRQANLEDSPWQPMQVTWGSCNFVYLTVSNGKYTVETAATSSLDFNKVVFTSPLYVGRNARLAYKVVNDSDLDLCYCFSPQLIKDGKVAYDGDMMLVTVPAHSEVEKDALVAFHSVLPGSVGGTYTLRLINRNSGEILGEYGDYEMTYVSTDLKVKLEELSIENCSMSEVTVGNRTFDAYVADDSSDFNIIFKYLVESGYLDTSVRLIASVYNPDTRKFVNFPDNIYYSTPFLGEGQTFEDIIPANFGKYDYKSVFRVAGSYLNAGSNAVLGIMYVTFKSNDVSEIEIGEAIQPVYYNMQGVKVESPSHGDMLIRRIGDKTDIIKY